MSGLDVNVADQMIVNEIDILDERVEFTLAMSWPSVSGGVNNGPQISWSFLERFVWRGVQTREIFFLQGSQIELNVCASQWTIGKKHI